MLFQKGIGTIYLDAMVRSPQGNELEPSPTKMEMMLVRKTDNLEALPSLAGVALSLADDVKSLGLYSIDGQADQHCCQKYLLSIKPGA